MSDFQQSVGRCSQFKLSLCNFNSAAVSCMTCASPILSRRRIRSQLREATHHRAMTIPVRLRGKRSHTHTVALRYVSVERFPQLRFKALPVKQGRRLYRPIRPIRIICGTFQPVLYLGQCFSYTQHNFLGRKELFKAVNPISLSRRTFQKHPCSPSCWLSRDRLIWMNIVYWWEPNSLIG